MSILRSILVASCCLMVSLFAGAAKADCQTFLDPQFQWLETNGAAVGFSYVAMQAEGAGLVTYTASKTFGSTGGILLRNGGTSMTSERFTPAATQLFSDRKINNQPFAISNPSTMHHRVDLNGTVWFISVTGAVVGQISNPVCENGVLYGWGPSLSTYTTPTMYIFRFFNTAQLN